jgi:hypothetical protein
MAERYRFGPDLVAVLLVAGFSLALFLVFLRDPLGHDDRRIFVYAGHLLDGARGMRAFEQTHFRLGFLLEHAFWQTLLGRNANAYYATALFNSVMAVGTVFFVSRLFLPRTATVVCALLLATNPYFLAQSSWPQVDWPAAWRFMAGLGLSVLTLRRSGMRVTSRLVCALGTAFFLWWAMYTKESVLPMFLLLPGLMVFVPFDRLSWKLAPLIIVLFAGFAGVGFGLQKHFFGHPLASFQKIDQARSFEFSQETYLDKGLIADDLSWEDLILRYPRIYWALKPGRALVLAATLAAAVALIARHRGLLLFLSLATAYWAATSLMVTSTDPLVPVLRTKDRYFAASFGLLMLLIGGAGCVLYQSLARRLPRPARLFWAGLWLVAATAAMAWQVDYHRRHPIGYNVEQLNDWADEGAFATIVAIASDGVDGRPVRRILSDTRKLEVLEMFASEEQRKLLTAFDQANRFVFESLDDFKPGDLLYINTGRLLSNQAKYYDNKVPGFVFKPPSTWKTVWSADKQRIVFVEPRPEVRGRPLSGPVAAARLFRAYPYTKGDAGRIERTETAEGVRFEIEQAKDVRVVSGAGKYHKPPATEGLAGLLAIPGPMQLGVAVTFETSGDVVVSDVLLVLFGHDGPALIGGFVESLEEGRSKASWVRRVDPGRGDRFFRVMLKVTGSGALQIGELSIVDMSDATTAP